MCELVKVNRKHKTIEIIDFPSIRIEAKHLNRLSQVEAHFNGNGVFK